MFSSTRFFPSVLGALTGLFVFAAGDVRAGNGADGIEHVEGVVEQVKRIDTTPLGGGNLLIVALTDGRQFQVRDREQIAAGSGVEVEILARPSADDELPRACRVRVLAMPVEIDGEEVRQRAERPFEVYRSDDPACEPDSSAQ